MTEQTTWKIESGSTKDHYFTMTGMKGVSAVFKQPRDQGICKLIEIANELIVYEVALRVGVPMSQTYLDYIDGKPAVVSVVYSRLNWGHILSQDLKHKVTNLESFRQLFAFDVWIANSDRSQGKNEHVIVVPSGESYYFYAIDHSHTLNGCTQGELIWKQNTVSDIEKYRLQNLRHVAEPEIHDYRELDPMVRKIEGLHDGTIDGIINSVDQSVSRGRPPEEQNALDQNCEVVSALLKFRRENIAKWLHDWCAETGRGKS